MMNKIFEMLEQLFAFINRLLGIDYAPAEDEVPVK